MRKNKRIIILLNLAVILGFFLYAITQKEKIIEQGNLLLFELAPYNNRSMMQGEYMALRFSIADTINLQNAAKRGYLVVEKDSLNVARYIGMRVDPTPPGENKYLVEYGNNMGQAHIGPVAFFIQEGQSEKYAKARYGGLRVDKKGNSVLVGLFDENKQLID